MSCPLRHWLSILETLDRNTATMTKPVWDISTTDDYQSLIIKQGIWIHVISENGLVTTYNENDGLPPPENPFTVVPLVDRDNPPG
jgi:hypothetical protein